MRTTKPEVLEMLQALVCTAMLILAAQATAEPLPWPFNMSVEDVTDSPQGITVTTTGGVFDFRPEAGTVSLGQRIGAQREVATLRLGTPALDGLRVLEQGAEAVRLRSRRGLRVTVTCDSVLRIESRRDALTMALDGSFSPQFVRSEGAGVLALDSIGGLGLYPLPALAGPMAVEHLGDGFSIRQDLPARSALLIGVCPPREYNFTQHAEERIVHHFPQLTPGVWVSDGASPRALPTDDELREWRKVAKVLVLHLEFWDGFGVRRIKPKDPTRFGEVVDLAHRLGFLVLPYSSPYYYQPALGSNGELRPDATAVYLEEARWLLDEYGVDGLYWDGEFTDILQAWECIRETRKLLGARRLYVHCTTNPLPYRDLYCPFVNCWADYLLRGEGLTRPTADQLYLRYAVSGYGISNAIGELCYDACRVDLDMANWALWANARIPYWPGAQVHGGRKYFLTPEEEEVFRNFYLPAADKVRGPTDYAPLAAVGQQEWSKRKREVAEEIEAEHRAFAEYLRAQQERLGATAADNLAAFKSGQCSGWVRRREGPHGVGYPLEYATDQSPDTYWGADFLPQWATVDLGTVETISRIWLQTYFGDERYYHYRVEASADGESWFPVGEKLDNALSTEKGDEYSFPPCQARYVGVTILHNSANNAGHIVELGVYR